MTRVAIGLILLGAAGIVALFLWYRYLTALELWKLKRSVSWLSEPDDRVRVLSTTGGIYDWEREGDL